MTCGGAGSHDFGGRPLVDSICWSWSGGWDWMRGAKGGAGGCYSGPFHERDVVLPHLLLLDWHCFFHHAIRLPFPIKASDSTYRQTTLDPLRFFSPYCPFDLPPLLHSQRANYSSCPPPSTSREFPTRQAKRRSRTFSASGMSILRRCCVGSVISPLLTLILAARLATSQSLQNLGRRIQSNRPPSPLRKKRKLLPIQTNTTFGP